MVLMKVFLIQKCCHKKREQYNDKACSSQRERIENLVICAVELSNIPEARHMYNDLYRCRHPEHLSVYTIEDDEEYKIQKRKKEHRVC